MYKQSEQEREDRIVREALSRLKGKVDYAPLLARLRRSRLIYLHELNPVFPLKSVPLIIRDLETLNAPIVCQLQILNFHNEFPGGINEGIIHFEPKTLSDLLCTWLEVTLKVSMSINVANGADDKTRQQAARFWRLYLYENMHALLGTFSRWN